MRRGENEAFGVALEWKPQGKRPIEEDLGKEGSTCGRRPKSTWS